MDIQKSQRLSQHLGVISDMVAYADIKDYMVYAGVLSDFERNCLNRKLQVEGNIAVMNELLTMISLRRGGFDAFLSALRQSDYVWIAEQLDPGKSLTEPSTSAVSSDDGTRNSVFQNFVKRISRKSEQAMSASQDDIIYTTYRDSCPLDIPINPSFYTNLDKSEGKATSSTHDTQNDTEALGMLKTLSLRPSLNKEVVIHNFDPGQFSNDSNGYFQNLVKIAKVPSPLLKNLKIVTKGKIAKKKPQSKKKIKLRFASDTSRKEFVDHLQDFIAKLEPSEPMYTYLKEVKVTIPDNKSKGTIGIRASKSSSHGTDGVKKNWFKKSFRLNSKKT